MAKNLEILLVEDNQTDIILLKKGIEAESMEVNIEVVETVEEGIDHLRKSKKLRETSIPNLIILDLNLPKDSGLKLLEYVKAESDFKTIPVIILTSSFDESRIHESYQKYASCFINKPENLSELTNMSKSIVDFWLKVAILPKNNSK
ncbi:MAG: response regulator [Roseivirga sp.]|uniref:response regulator n=1 Tax=Roseivirga sp. TaxID=1964215 RepID=UPI001B268817|nr:response regulator [Roseivirga sp.]MBO6662520.1 response regulator [Roseivirga sp.]MBO6909917.1 response regulator [Roseivirga sp.]